MQANADRVQVSVRSRPLSSYERSYSDSTTTEFSQSKPEISLRNPKSDQSLQPKTFSFDSIYDSETTQEQFYQSVASPAVNSVLQGQDYTILAYGKTAVGKTHTILGKNEPKELRGIGSRACEQIFKQIEAMPERQFSVEISCFELFNDQLKDLLASDSSKVLELRETKSGTVVKDLCSVKVKTLEEALELLQNGRGNRSVPQNSINIESYGGHLFLTINVYILNSDGEKCETKGQLRLVDLAGSEKMSKAGCAGSRFKEIVKTNGSLAVLEQVISALANPKTSFIPYRNSKLTRLLQDCLGGPNRLIMIANISPAECTYDETLATLKVAQQARKLNERKVGTDREKLRRNSAEVDNQESVKTDLERLIE